MKVIATTLALLLSFTMTFGATTSKKNGLRKLVSATDCTTMTLYGEGDAPTSTALKAGEIVTIVVPLYSDTTLATEVGEWEMYCVGLGADQDPAGGQICTSIFVFEDGDKVGEISGTSVYDVGGKEMSIIVTGGTGGHADASGEVVVTYDTTYSLAFSVCYWKTYEAISLCGSELDY